MKWKVNVVVIDDLPMYAQKIENTLIERNKNSVSAEYIPITFCKDTHFADAQNFIYNNYKEIDLIFSDYHLDGGGNGIDLFNLFKQKNVRPYRVLHSNTSKRFGEHSEEFQDNLFDAFSRSKSPKELNEKLSGYEGKILNIKKLGNLNFFKSYYDSNLNELSEAIENIGKFRLLDIVSITTNDDLHTIIYREFKDGRMKIMSDKITGKNYRIGAFMEKAEDLQFARLNQSQLINLLWVSKIDVYNKAIHFISPDPLIRILPVTHFSSESNYRETYEGFIGSLSQNIPSFFY